MDSDNYYMSHAYAKVMERHLSVKLKYVAYASVLA